MQPLVGPLVIRFLEDLERADARVVEDAKLLDLHRGRVDVAPSDLAPAATGLDLHVHDGPQALGDVIDAGLRVLAVDDDQPLVADLAGQHLDLPADLVLGQDPPAFRMIAASKTAVNAVIDAQIAHVQRREGHDAIVVDLRFDRRGGLPHLGQQLRVRDVDQTGRFIRRQRLDGERLGQDVADPLGVTAPVGRQSPLDRGLVDEVPTVVEILLDLLGLDPIADPPSRGLVVLHRRHKNHPLRQSSIQARRCLWAASPCNAYGAARAISR